MTQLSNIARSNIVLARSIMRCGLWSLVLGTWFHMTWFSAIISLMKLLRLFIPHITLSLSLSLLCLRAVLRPDSVDAALRRPGRFDRELCVDLPGPQDRAAILQVIT